MILALSRFAADPLAAGLVVAAVAGLAFAYVVHALIRRR